MSDSDRSRDQQHMQRALALALRGQGRVEPNPMVGCVIVRGRRVVGEGYHRGYGGPHAEVHALRAAGNKARGATVYVTLEPCCHHGKTPPCTDALLKAGVSRVVVGMRDPFPPVRGRGCRILRKAGIEVATGVRDAESRALNAPYIKLQTTGRPWVILKWAQSLDGKIATRTGDSKWISGEASRRYAHRLRARMDAVVVGVGTAITDDPDLTCRHVRPRRVSTRIVIDPQLRIPTSARLVRKAGEVPTLIVTRRQMTDSTAARKLRKAGVEVIPVRQKNRQLDLVRLLDELGGRRMTNVLIEGGGKTLGPFFDAGLADEAIVFVSRRLIGGQDAPGPLAGRGLARMADIDRPSSVIVRHYGEDDVYHLKLREASAR